MWWRTSSDLYSSLIRETNQRLPGLSTKLEPLPVDPSIRNAQREGATLLLWYTSHSGHPPRTLLGWDGTYHIHKECRVPCVVTDDRRLLPQADGLLFDLCHLEQLPEVTPASPRRPWLGMATEAPPSTRTRILEDPARMSLFNYSSTFPRSSDVSVRNIMRLGAGTLKETFPWAQKTHFVAYFASNCATSSERDSFVKELMGHIEVDSYGDCLYNMNGTRLPKENARHQYDPTAKLAALRKYKFVLVLANTLCEDYVDEKVEDAFLAGAVPVVLGSSRFSDYEPSSTTRSMIHITDFPEVGVLAQYLTQLGASEHDYNEYLAFRSQAMKQDIVVPEKRPDDTMECFMCEAVHRAHETVLDLVCRLLLEKKKTKKIKNA
eukprot:TRINITY_DN10402_c0_g2_i3.p1 TRINITY_DN10402_c0_g2~~TRINITY_DN10402_c0_g2_i3.p1  ORF type:complete len:378 (+),score=59.01 TRINITY_DN10402_c0_g2_i3:232-1365(+)